jgi:hypothetical protein
MESTEVYWIPGTANPIVSIPYCLQVPADFLPLLCRPRTSSVPSSLAPITTRMGTRLMCLFILIRKVTPSTKRYMIFSRERPRLLQVTTVCFNPAVAFLASAVERVRPISLLAGTCSISLINGSHHEHYNVRILYIILRWLGYRIATDRVNTLNPLEGKGKLKVEIHA